MSIYTLDMLHSIFINKVFLKNTYTWPTGENIVLKKKKKQSSHPEDNVLSSPDSELASGTSLLPNWHECGPEGDQLL